MPCLTVVADMAGMLAGGWFVYSTIGTSLSRYIRAALDSLYVRDIVSGLIKSIVFATLITQVGCLQGFRVKGSPEDVGRAATSAVVRAIILVIVADLLFTALVNVRLVLSSIRTRLSAEGNGEGRRRTASTMLKTAVFAPIPNAKTKTVAVVKSGFLRSQRTAHSKSKRILTN